MKREELLLKLKEAHGKADEGRGVCSQLAAKLAELEGQQGVSVEVLHEELTALTERKQDLQADFAMGKAEVKKELGEVDAAIAKTQQALDNLLHAIPGLRRKLTAAESHLSSSLEFEVSKLTLNLVGSDAEQLHEEYLACAEKLIAKFRRLSALGHITKSLTHDSFSSGTEHQFLSIPMFALGSSRELRNSPSWPLWAPARDVQHNVGGMMAADVASERERLAAEGILVK